MLQTVLPSLLRLKLTLVYPINIVKRHSPQHSLIIFSFYESNSSAVLLIKTMPFIHYDKFFNLSVLKLFIFKTFLHDSNSAFSPIKFYFLILQNEVA